ncbi:MAG: hypothetical protein KF761_14490 [Salinibacterium sp.]|nr:hypothetical protein [Salinibacterium sp.]
MDDSDKARIRATSDIAFGQMYRLECMLAIAANPTEQFSLSSLADELRLRPSQIQVAFKALVDTGLLAPVPTSDHRRKGYRVNGESAALRWAEELEARSLAMK